MLVHSCMFSALPCCGEEGQQLHGPGLLSKKVLLPTVEMDARERQVVSGSMLVHSCTYLDSPCCGEEGQQLDGPRLLSWEVFLPTVRRDALERQVVSGSMLVHSCTHLVYQAVVRRSSSSMGHGSVESAVTLHCWQSWPAD